MTYNLPLYTDKTKGTCYAFKKLDVFHAACCFPSVLSRCIPSDGQTLAVPSCRVEPRPPHQFGVIELGRRVGRRGAWRRGALRRGAWRRGAL